MHLVMSRIHERDRSLACKGSQSTEHLGVPAHLLQPPDELRVLGHDLINYESSTDRQNRGEAI